MAEDMDSDTCVGFKRTIKEIQETPTLTQRSNSPSAAIPEQDSHSSEIDSPLKQDSDFTDRSPPCSVSDSSKKVKLSPHGQVSETHLEEIHEMPNYVSGKAEACEAESQSSLELKKKQLLEEVEAILVPAEKTLVQSVIDDTAMISLLGNGCGKELGFLGPAKCVAQGNGNKNAKKEMNGKKKARTSGRKEKWLIIWLKLIA
ncbi:hypothetical protein Pyn_07073 [Prunus yedoensis var. nudiflora]|uniref:Uncharacterized protein n=1 Tax=Prunus yedoensis var. nudiflora TaxID=2094558 RepID=A0A314ZQU1_PRUYE|nr:hypothetical protein Pyn_07073 [Prunus yedoensis var. nudiflora]